jgi:hypothetical protein
LPPGLDYGVVVVVPLCGWVVLLELLVLLVTWPDDGLLVEVLLFRAPGSVLVAPLVVPAPMLELDDEPVADELDELRLSVVPVSVEEHAATPIATRPARISF